MVGPRRLCALLGAFALALAACGGGSDGPAALPTDKAERLIRQLADGQYADHATIGRVSCPHDIPKRKDANFACTVQVGGQPLRVVVVQTDGAGHVELQQAQAVLVTKENEAFIADYAARNNQPTKSVSCGGTPIVIRAPGKRIQCEVTLPDGSTVPAVIGVRDTKGNIALISFQATKAG